MGNNVSLKINRVSSVLMCCGGASSCAALFMFAALYFKTACSVLGALPALITLCCASAAAVAVIPFFYMLVNKIMSGAWGRYHLAIALITLILPLSLAMIWGMSKDSSLGFNVAVTAVSFILYASLSAILKYISYSIKTRLLSENKKTFSRGLVFDGLGLVLGALLAALTLFSLSAENAGYILSLLTLIEGLTLYFSTYPYIPRFMRPLQRKVSLSGAYKAFFKEKRLGGVLSLSACFLGLAAVVAGVSLLFGGFGGRGFPPMKILLLYGVGSAVFILFYLLLIEKNIRLKSGIFGATLLLLSIAAFVVTGKLLSLDESVRFLIDIAVSAGSALGAAFLTVSSLKYADRILPLGIYTRGVSVLLKAMMIIAGFGMGIAVSAASFLASAQDILAASFAGLFVLGFAASAIAEKTTDKNALLTDSAKKTKDSGLGEAL